MPDMTNQQYAEYVMRKSPTSPLWGDLLRAFLIGGAICALGQVITELWVMSGLPRADAGTACSMTLVFLGALCTGLGVYDDAAKFGGAGTLVPITGFANAVVSPALEFKSEGFITGTAAKMFIIAGPVIVFGTCASIIYGLILCLIG